MVYDKKWSWQKMALIMLTAVMLTGVPAETVCAEEQSFAVQDELEAEVSTKANESVMISYSAHVQSKGWVEEKNNGEQMGTTGSGLRMEALKIHVSNIQNYTGQVLYRSHIQTYGWEEEWRSDNELSGTVGESKRLEAIQIKLTGELEQNYDVYYRVHAETYGWLDWAKNGQVAGSSGYSKRLEAIQILLVDKGEEAPGEMGYSYMNDQTGVSYLTHVQTYGWQTEKTNGIQAGTSGESKRLEAIQIQLKNAPYDGSIEYQSHVQTYGWENEWKSDGEISGTSGQSKRLEAIRIRLTGELAEKYDVYYRVHCQKVGWLGWVKNGEEAGTAGFSYRMEAIQILVLPKGARTFDTAGGFVSKDTTEQVPSWSVSEIATSLGGKNGMIQTPIELSVNTTGNDAITCEYTAENQTTGAKENLGTCRAGEKVIWTPTVSGSYTITMNARDNALREIRKQITISVEHGAIYKEDAFFTAHRGLSSKAPDNSIPAFVLAGEAGFDSIETDVNETKDGVFVLSHDNNLKNICGIDKNISDLTSEELKDYGIYHITAGHNVSSYSTYELRIPTLEEYLDICEEYGCIPQIDTKNLNSFESITKLYEILCERELQNHVIITSFNNLYLQLLRELDSEIVLTYGIDNVIQPDFTWCENYNVGVSVNYSNYWKNRYDICLDKNILVNVYSVNDEKMAGILLDSGVASITTNNILWQ